MKIDRTHWSRLAPSGDVNVVVIHRPKGRRLAAPATLLPFPPPRRQRLIRKIAVIMHRKKSYGAADSYLASQLARELRAIKRAQVPLAMQRQIICSLESAVRGELWRLMFGPLSGSGKS
jgi:hypothetical protein